MIYTPELAGWKWFTLTWQNWMKLKIFVWILLPLKIKTFLNFGWQIRWVSSNISGITGFLENSGWHSMTELRLSCVLSLSPKVASPPVQARKWCISQWPNCQHIGSLSVLTSSPSPSTAGSQSWLWSNILQGGAINANFPAQTKNFFSFVTILWLSWISKFFFARAIFFSVIFQGLKLPIRRYLKKIFKIGLS